MASIQQTKTGWRAQLSIKGVRDSQVFPSKREAQVWAARRETELRTIAAGRGDEVYTLGDLFTRYSLEVSPEKRGGRWEKIRLAALPSTGGSLLKANTRLQACSPALLAQWRDRRLTEVKKGTVLRELTLLSAAFARAQREWGWVRENPVRGISKPTKPAHRDRVLSRQEIYSVLRQLRRTPGKMPKRVELTFLFALRTGMRAGEICGLKWKHINGNAATLPMTKNGGAREVPLSKKAQAVLRRCDKGAVDSLVFGIKTGTLDALFRRARARAGLSGFTFHDARHTYATHVAARMVEMGISFPEFLQMFGWKDPKYAMIYVNTKASDIAAKLDK